MNKHKIISYCTSIFLLAFSLSLSNCNHKMPYTASDLFTFRIDTSGQRINADSVTLVRLVCTLKKNSDMVPVVQFTATVGVGSNSGFVDSAPNAAANATFTGVYKGDSAVVYWNPGTMPGPVMFSVTLQGTPNQTFGPENLTTYPSFPDRILISTSTSTLSKYTPVPVMVTATFIKNNYGRISLNLPFVFFAEQDSYATTNGMIPVGLFTPTQYPYTNNGSYSLSSFIALDGALWADTLNGAVTISGSFYGDTLHSNNVLLYFH